MKLNILGLNVRALKGSDLAKDSPEHEGMMLAGYYDPVKKVIAIDESLVGDEFFHTLLHEIIHATLHRAGLMQTSLSADLQEVICEIVPHVIVENFELRLKEGS